MRYITRCIVLYACVVYTFPGQIGHKDEGAWFMLNSYIFPQEIVNKATDGW